MRDFRRNIYLGLGIAVIAFFAGAWLLASRYGILEMRSSSMEPIVHGRRPNSDARGDLVIFLKHPQRNEIHNGDLVIVSFWFDRRKVFTVRRVGAVPGQPIPAGRQPEETNRVSPPMSYWITSESTNGVDSAQLGLVSAQQIEGLVLRIVR